MTRLISFEELPVLPPDFWWNTYDSVSSKSRTHIKQAFLNHDPTGAKQYFRPCVLAFDLNRSGNDGWYVRYHIPGTSNDSPQSTPVKVDGLPSEDIVYRALALWRLTGDPCPTETTA